MTSRERMLRAGRGESVDRVPIGTPIPFWPVQWAERGEDYEPHDPLWAEVAPLCAKHCDVNVSIGGPVAQLFDRRFLLTPSEHIERLPVTDEGEWRLVRHIVRTPRGDLTTTDAHQPGSGTSWCTEPLVKTVEDAEALLSVPYEFRPPDLAESLANMERIGELAMPEINVSTPLVSVSRLMHFDQFLLWCAAERQLIHRLIGAMCERILLGLDHALKAGLGPCMWIGGSEQGTPPMMGLEMYDEYAMAYDRRIIDLAHSHGCLVHVHCHGNVRGIMARLVDMGVDLLDPVEPPPDGDITFAEAKELSQRKITLMGNIEFRELEFSTPQRIRELVKRAILDGGPERVLLFPSATPHEPLTPTYRDNAIAYIEAGLEFGRLN